MNREKIIEKIKALLNKTVDNGCSEEEMGAALDKARALMDAHEITEAPGYGVYVTLAHLKTLRATSDAKNGIGARKRCPSLTPEEIYQRLDNHIDRISIVKVPRWGSVPL